MTKGTDIEILYQIIDSLQKVNAPVSIKGGLVLKAILDQYNADIDRKTIDIDADWLRRPPDINEMRDLLEQAIQLAYPDYKIDIVRNFGERQSAGFNILDNENRIITKIDIDVGKTPDTSLYKIQGITFRGASIENILADKITAISTPRVFRRTKDILDIYVVNQYVKYNRQKLINCLKDKVLGNFSTLKDNKDSAEHAYNKLRDITNKPDFDTVYQSDIQFCESILQEIQRANNHEKEPEKTRSAPRIFRNRNNMIDPKDDIEPKPDEDLEPYDPLGGSTDPEQTERLQNIIKNTNARHCDQETISSQPTPAIQSKTTPKSNQSAHIDQIRPNGQISKIPKNEEERHSFRTISEEPKNSKRKLPDYSQNEYDSPNGKNFGLGE